MNNSFTIPPDLQAIALVGPTGIGKTSLSLKIAETFSCEIISVDSMQIYRHMDIGTAKASMEERQRIPHHLIDIIDPNEEYNLARFVADASLAIKDILSRNKIPLLVGGTGLYLKGLLDGVFFAPQIDEAIRKKLSKQLAEQGREALYEELIKCDQATAARIHPNDTYRLLRSLEIYLATGTPWSEHLAGHVHNKLFRNILEIGLSCDREELYQRINARIEVMIRTGLLEEVQKLLTMGYSSDLPAMNSIGYRHMVCYLNGEWDWDHTTETFARDTRRYAKRQFTWFKKDNNIKWFNPYKEDSIFSLITSYLGNNGSVIS